MPKAARLRSASHPPSGPGFGALVFFEAAARLESFAGGGAELGVTSAAVAYRVRSLEKYLGVTLFKRFPRGVRLTEEGKSYWADIHRILAELHQVNRHLRGTSRNSLLKLVAAEVVAEKWLMPRLADFKSAHPDLAIEFETDGGVFDPEDREFDVWIAFIDEAEATQQCETLFQETLVPVCSPALVEARGRPAEPSDLHRWPLLYDLAWAPSWARWFAHHGAPPADLFQASGFRLHGMMVRAAVEGMGVALGHAAMIADELERGTLLPLFDSEVPAPARYVLCLSRDAADRTEARAFRDWVLEQAAGQSTCQPPDYVADVFP